MEGFAEAESEWDTGPEKQEKMAISVVWATRGLRGRTTLWAVKDECYQV